MKILLINHLGIYQRADIIISTLQKRMWREQRISNTHSMRVIITRGQILKKKLSATRGKKIEKASIA